MSGVAQRTIDTDMRNSTSNSWLQKFENKYRSHCQPALVAETMCEYDSAAQSQIIDTINEIEQNGGGDDCSCFPSPEYKCLVLKQVFRRIEYDMISPNDTFCDVFARLINKPLRTKADNNTFSEYLTFPKFCGEIRGHPHPRPQPLAIRVFPKHNDVAMRLWEACCFMIEYLTVNSDLVQSKSVMEIGSGCGLLGMIAVMQLEASKFVMTDISAECLDNMRHNVAINSLLLGEKAEHLKIAELDWKEITSFPDYLDVICGCDILYDPNDISYIVKAFELFLSTHYSKRKILLATTYRNASTFELLLQTIEKTTLTYVEATYRYEGNELFAFDQFLQTRDAIRLFIFSSSP